MPARSFGSKCLLQRNEAHVRSPAASASSILRGRTPASTAQHLQRRGILGSCNSPGSLQRMCPCRVTPFDQAWGPALDAENLFAFSLFPYLGFLYHLTRSKQAPPLMLFGFYFLLVFVFATIPAGIYAKKVYGQALANVDWLHGSAEFLLTLTNLFIVLGLRDAIRKAEAAKATSALDSSEVAVFPPGTKQPSAPRE